MVSLWVQRHFQWLLICGVLNATVYLLTNKQTIDIGHAYLRVFDSKGNFTYRSIFFYTMEHLRHHIHNCFNPKIHKASNRSKYFHSQVYAMVSNYPQGCFKNKTVPTSVTMSLFFRIFMVWKHINYISIHLIISTWFYKKKNIAFGNSLFSWRWKTITLANANR